MTNLTVIILTISAFWLGACPFSVWFGRWFLHKDIQQYGDGNPGAANVFLAGGREVGLLALIFDIGKGFIFVFAAHEIFGLPELTLLLIGMGAVLGHAFSPILGFHGGKAVAITYGVLLAFPQYWALISLAFATLMAFILIDNDAWTVLVGASASFIFMLVIQGNTFETGFMLFVLILFIYKFHREILTVPSLGRLAHWLQSRKT